MESEKKINISQMFSNCLSLSSLPDLAKWELINNQIVNF